MNTKIISSDFDKYVRKKCIDYIMDRKGSKADRALLHQVVVEIEAVEEVTMLKQYKEEIEVTNALKCLLKTKLHPGLREMIEHTIKRREGIYK